ncbi:universal stress protein [Nocardia bovistercoris]|uniref:Universal stress protein n=1 Tax=Nocardia bovistercoris TaxID=2785916 RepID=A0A931IGQ7_9NOCA|nr:universal stress protein [Nocardia bovistercoris]MBH0779358.1 universal stress protein [Nocardia bovistercoris]
MADKDVDDRWRGAAAPIVVGVTDDGASDPAVCWAAKTAARRGRRLRLVHGLDLVAVHSALGAYDVIGKGPTEHRRERGVQALAAARRLANALAPDLAIDLELSEANPVRLLTDASDSAHMVVLGATNGVGGVGHLGSVLFAVTAHGRGSIVVVRDAVADARARPYGPVVVGVDGGEASADAVAVAFAEADARRVPLLAVHSWSDLRFDCPAVLPDTFGGADFTSIGHRVVAESLAGWPEKYPEVEVIRRIYLSNPRRHLRQWSKTAQLLVVGSRGRGGITGLVLGSTSLFLVQRADCPVMVVHPH